MVHRVRGWLGGIRARMVGLVLITIIPLVVIYVIQTSDRRDQARQEADADALRLSRLAADREAAALDQARTVLAAATSLTQAPLNNADCPGFLSALQAQVTAGTNTVTVSADGVVGCSTTPGSVGVDVGDRASVQGAADLGEFVAGPELPDALSAEPALLGVLPIDGYAPTAMLGAVVDAGSTMAAFMDDLGLPSGSTILLVDADGMVLSSTGAFNTIGQPIPMQSLVDQLAAGAAEGVVTDTGADDTERVYGYADVGATQQSVFAIVGIPTDAAFAASDRELRTDLLAGAVVGAVALVIALLLSEASVARPLRTVVATVRRIGQGDLGARTPPMAGGGEISELAHSVDDMAGDLQARDQSLRDASEEREHLLGELLNAQEDERRRIASDIHDDTMQTMIAAGLEVQLLRQDVAADGTGGDDAVDRARAVERTIQEAVGRLRHLMFELEPPHSEEGLEASIELYLDAVLATTSAAVEVTSDGGREPSGAARQVMYRNVREAAVNAVRHGGATRVTVALRAEEGGLAVEVTDDGTGFDASVEPPVGHLGLRTMQRRTEALSGRFQVDSAPGHGTTVSFWLPE